MKNMTDEAKIKKKEIVEVCLKEFLVKGLERTSVRDLCKVLNISGSTLYYYFETKDKIILECVKYEIEVINSVVQSVIALQPPTVTDFLKKLLDEVAKGCGGIRFIAQVLASPNHYRACRSEIITLHKRYEQYARQICNNYSIPFEMFKPIFFIYLTVSYDYFIKGDEEFFKVQMDAVFDGIEKMCIKEF